MAGMSNYLREKVLNWFRGTAFPAAPTNIYISLHTADPGTNGASEVSGGNYARQTVAVPAGLNAPVDSGSDELIDNVNAISWAAVTWAATITHVGIWDAATVGNYLGGGALTASKVVVSGDTVTFAAGALDVTQR